MDKREARKLVDQARAGLVSAEQAIKKIITLEAWTALGYGSFVELWRAEFSDIRLASESMKAAVVYAMFDAGASPIDVATEVSGIGPVQAKALREDYDATVPVDLARPVRVNPYNRKLPGATRTIHVKVDAGMYQEWHELATKIGTTIRDEAEQAIREHFDDLMIRAESGDASR